MRHSFLDNPMHTGYLRGLLHRLTGLAVLVALCMSAALLANNVMRLAPHPTTVVDNGVVIAAQSACAASYRGVNPTPAQQVADTQAFAACMGGQGS